MPEHVLIAAISGRALAQAARLDGFAPLVADLFADDDTRAVAAAVERLPGRWLRERPLWRVLSRLAEGRSPIGLVIGSGFERHPEMLMRLPMPVFGNAPDTVRSVKNAMSFAGLCDRLGIPHPAIRLDQAPGPGWLSKRSGGAGGSHVRPATPGRRVARGRYVQQRVQGEPISALFLANGTTCRILGFSEQWAAPRPRHPFRYGGAAAPARLAPGMEEALSRAVHALSEVTELRGLCSADFLVGADGFHLLEINPRPGATLDLFAQPGLFRAHLSGCQGEAIPTLPALPGARASAIAYARRPIVLPPGFDWPGWAADRQPAGVPVPTHAPFCTVHAESPGIDAARALAGERIELILRLAEAAQ